MYARAERALAALVVLLTVSCSKISVREPIKEIDIEGTDLMSFTCLNQESAPQSAFATKASQALTSGFAVSTFKAFGTPGQFTVMDYYNVEYKTSGNAWDGSVRPYWDYTQVSGQFQKYWDFSAFPYRFNAVSPYPANPSDVSLTDKTLSLHNAVYKMQTVHNGLVSPSDDKAEPYLVAQVERGTEGNDFDYMATTGPKEINNASLARNRYVSLPFHHLNSKVRFGVFCTAPWATANSLYIEGLTVKIASPDFVTQATGYNATGDSWYDSTANSGFGNLVKASGSGTQLLRFDGGKDVPENNLSLHQGRSSAFWLQCPDGIMQMPQKDVQLHVSFRLRTMDGTLYKEFTNVLIRMDDGTDRYDWVSGYVNTYYLIIGEIQDELQIEFTATLTPWEDISGSLSTNLEQ